MVDVGGPQYPEKSGSRCRTGAIQLLMDAPMSLKLPQTRNNRVLTRVFNKSRLACGRLFVDYVLRTDSLTFQNFHCCSLGRHSHLRSFANTNEIYQTLTDVVAQWFAWLSDLVGHVPHRSAELVAQLKLSCVSPVQQNLHWINLSNWLPAPRFANSRPKTMWPT